MNSATGDLVFSGSQTRIDFWLVDVAICVPNADHARSWILNDGLSVSLRGPISGIDTVRCFFMYIGKMVLFGGWKRVTVAVAVAIFAADGVQIAHIIIGSWTAPQIWAVQTIG